MALSTKKEMTKLRYILTYTLVFSLFCLGVFALFLKKGKSFIWDQDGATQYLPYLAYMGQYLRDFVFRALHGDFTIKMFDFTIGLGDDVGSVIRAHPLDFLSVFVPVAYTELLYHFLIILRLYLGGLAFSALCMLWRKPSISMITGSMIYVFCGHMMIYGLRHPTFLSAFIVLPLLLLAAERMMKGRGLQGAFLFAVTVFIGFMSNYYFMYMCTIVMLVFIVLRFPVHYRESRVKNFVLLFFRMGSVFILGAMMSMATLLPIIYSLRASARIAEQSKPENLLVYKDTERYFRWYLDLIEPYEGIGSSTFLNYAAPALPALLLAFCAGRKRRMGTWKLGFLAALACMLIPFGGYAMAGFSNVNNRWIFAFSLLAALAFVLMEDQLREMSLSGWIIVAVGTVVYVGLAVYDYRSDKKIYSLIGAAALGVTILLLVLIRLCKIGEKSAQLMLLALTFICCSTNAYVCYSNRFGDVASEYYDRNTGMSAILNSEFAPLGQIEDDTFWRADTNLITSGKENYPLLLNYNGSSMYNSVLNGAMTYGLLETGNIGLAAIHRIQGLDSRTVTEALANEKYYLTTVDGEKHVPYGYEYNAAYSNENNSVYENTMPLPFGYTYDTVIRRSDFDVLDEVSKELVMMDAVVLEDEASDMAGEFSEIKDCSAEILRVPLELPESGSNLERTSKGYKVGKGGGSLTIPIERKAGYDCYLQLHGLSKSETYTFIYVTALDLRTLMTMRGPGKMYSLNRTEYTVNLGYDEKDQPDTLQIDLTSKGKYKFSGAEMVYVPMAGYEKQIEKLSETALTDPVFSANTVEGNVSCSESKVMVFSIPYSSGWRAYLDGERVSVQKANVSYMGIFVPEGDHQIRLVYSAPGSTAGRALALAGWMICLILLAGSALGRRKK